MKKSIVFFLILLHSVASSGLLLSHHYCGGEYVATQMDLSGGVMNAELCDGCGDTEEDEDSACCESKEQLIKKTIELQHDQHQEWDGSYGNYDWALVVHQYFSGPSFSFASELPVLYKLQRPPPLGIALYKEICCYRI